MAVSGLRWPSAVRRPWVVTGARGVAASPASRGSPGVNTVAATSESGRYRARATTGGAIPWVSRADCSPRHCYHIVAARLQRSTKCPRVHRRDLTNFIKRSTLPLPRARRCSGSRPDLGDRDRFADQCGALPSCVVIARGGATKQSRAQPPRCPAARDCLVSLEMTRLRSMQSGRTTMVAIKSVAHFSIPVNDIGKRDERLESQMSGPGG